jgi:two-component system, OmpR family, sensor histidine kinase KdpD
MDVLSLNKISWYRQTSYAVMAVMIASLICYFFSDWIGYRVVALILLLVVSMLAVIFDIVPVLLAASLSAFIWDFFFIPPRFNFHVGTAEDTFLLGMYFIIALINGVFTYKIRQAEKISRIKEERANSVQLYNTILDSLSHELRTPIAAIIGATDNLQMNKHLDEKNRLQLIAEISKASLRLNGQIENLLNISRLESGHIAPKKDWVDMMELVHEVVYRVEDNNGGRKIDVSIQESFPLCFTDKGMLDQVMYNLLNNAAIHTEDSSKISIVLSCHADLLQVIVEDTGAGFSDAEMRSAFKKFSRDKQTNKERSGLGLSIVKGFTEALQGTVELKRGAAGGARFIITIPVKTSNSSIYAEQARGINSR